MYMGDMVTEPSQSFAYELKGDSAVILRCFSRDTRAEIPEMLEGHVVTEVGAYAFSAHMDEKAFEKGIRSGKIRIYIPAMMRKRMLNATDNCAAGISGAGGDSVTGISGTAGGCAAGRPTAAGNAAICGHDNLKEILLPDEPALAGNFLKEILLPDAPALAGNFLEEIVIPYTVRRIGRYCFYNCAKLEKMTFGGSLQDWGAGAFTGVHHVKEITVSADAEGKTSLKQVLDELHEEITVTYFDEQGRESHLVFPEYFEEGIENTPARILEERIHGSGMMYRNCIKEGRMDFRQYDSRFDHAGFLESRNMTVRLSIGRLQYPTELSEKAQQQYEAYVIGNAQEAADHFLKVRDLEGVRWLLELFDRIAEKSRDNLVSISVEQSLENNARVLQGRFSENVNESDKGHSGEKVGDRMTVADVMKQKQTALQGYMMEVAAGMQFTEATGFLMNFGRVKKRPARKRLEL